MQDLEAKLSQSRLLLAKAIPSTPSTVQEPQLASSPPKPGLRNSQAYAPYHQRKPSLHEPANVRHSDNHQLLLHDKHDVHVLGSTGL